MSKIDKYFKIVSRVYTIPITTIPTLSLILLAKQADYYVLLDDVAAAVMRVVLMTTIGPRNANDVEHVAGGMSDSGDECLDGDRGEKRRERL